MKKGYVGGVVLGLALFVGVVMLLVCTERVPVGYEGVVR